jgi:two-component system, NarL family, sensor histidine kinase DesK
VTAPPRTPQPAVPPASLGTGGTVALLAFLLFLGFPLRVFLQADPGPVHAVLVLAGLAAFVAIYLRVMWAARSEADTRRSIAAMAVIAVALSADGTAEWATTFVYVSAAAGFRLEPPLVERVIGAATLATAVASFGHGYPVGDSVAYTIYALAIGALLRGYAHLVRLNHELSAARDEIARLAVADERLRFARDLHDLLGHSLSLIALKSELAGRLLATDPERAGTEVGDIERVSREALVEVREAVSGYRTMTLAAELRGAREALDAAGIEATISRPSATFSPDVESLLAWAVREGTTNVIRHSGARRCEIRVHAGLADAGVEILDDGPMAAPGPPAAATGAGLSGLSERAGLLAGRLEAGRRPGGGFRLAIDLPVRP